MIVDDRFPHVGSANLTNRSLALDTELNASVETEQPTTRWRARSARCASEPVGRAHRGDRPLALVEGLVAELDRLAGAGRAHAHGACRLALPPFAHAQRARRAEPDRSAVAAVRIPIRSRTGRRGAERLLSGLGQRVRELFASRHDKG
jgi:phosphatidylserine/phosphatidylglycerophosphate/cardiolipin synthase-like enzyme